MLFEMLTGRVPFGPDSNVEWLNAVLTEDPPPLGKPELTALDPVITRALQRRPDDRFTTIDEMAEALRQAMRGESQAHGESTPARRRSPIPFGRSFCRFDCCRMTQRLPP